MNPDLVLSLYHQRERELETAAERRRALAERTAAAPRPRAPHLRRARTPHLPMWVTTHR